MQDDFTGHAIGRMAPVTITSLGCVKPHAGAPVT
jgi:hypothetical protein